MATPTITSVSPGSVVAGAAPVTVTIGGTNFLTAPTVTIGDLQVTGVVESGGNSITAKVYAPPGHSRSALDVRVTNTDSGTVLDAGAVKVVAPAVSSGALDAYPANALPGSTPGASVTGTVDASVIVAGGSAPSAHPYVDMVGNPSARATPGMDVLNPAFSVANEISHGTSSVEDGITVEVVDQQQDANVALTAAQDAGLSPSDRAGDNPSADVGSRDTGFAVGDEHTAQLPKAPTIGAVSSGSAGHATVNWTAPVDADGYALTGYEIVATSSDGGASPLTYEVAVGTSATIAGLTSAKHYTFKVAAKNIAGTGAQSAASASQLIA